MPPTAKLEDIKAHQEKVEKDKISPLCISCLEKLPVAADIEMKIIDARTALGLYLLQIILPVEARVAVEPIVDLAVKLNYRRKISQIYFILGAWLVLLFKGLFTRGRRKSIESS